MKFIKDVDGRMINCEKIVSVVPFYDERVEREERALHLHFEKKTLNTEDTVKNILRDYRGNEKVFLRYGENKKAIPCNDFYTVDVSNTNLIATLKGFLGDNNVFVSGGKEKHVFGSLIMVLLDNDMQANISPVGNTESGSDKEIKELCSSLAEFFRAEDKMWPEYTLNESYRIVNVYKE